jgi:hypothetical protein
MKIQYFEKIECERYENENKVILCKDFCYYIDAVKHWIPKDYYFDGASIPRPFWPIIGSPFEPILFEPSGVHDWLYLTHLFDRNIADDCLYQLMIQNKVNTVKAHIIWGAVRSCAWFAWKNTAKDKAELGKINAELAKREDGKKFFS